jgi:Asp-tRNA(Asn)/Glu-tRNA(Gln) amidotransferase A subunit family amidase
MDQGWASIDADVRANTRAAATHLQMAGAAVNQIDLKLDTTDERLRETIEKAPFHGHRRGANRPPFQNR